MTTTNDTTMQPAITDTDRELATLLAVADGLFNLILTADATPIILQTSPLLWDAGWELRSELTQTRPTATAVLGNLLALRAILRSPDVLQVAASRLSDRISALLQVDALAGDVETLARILPACTAIQHEPLANAR